jgi:uncharacterized protein (DUF1697 family)
VPPVRHAAFIRNVMVGGEGLTRVVLLGLGHRAGGTRPVSHLATGNLTFDLAPASLPEWVAGMEAGIAGVIGLREQIFVRSMEYLETLVASDPFAAAPFAHPRDRAVSFCRPG